MSYTPPAYNAINGYNEEAVDPIQSFEGIIGSLEDERALHRVKMYSVEDPFRAMKFQLLDSNTNTVRPVTLWAITHGVSSGTFDNTFDASFS